MSKEIIVPEDMNCVKCKYSRDCFDRKDIRCLGAEKIARERKKSGDEL